MEKENQIRTTLLLKINSEINNQKNKIEFKSLSRKKHLINSFKIEFKEFFQGNIFQKDFISNNLFQFDSPICELDTNPISLNSNTISKEKEDKNEFIIPLKYLHSLCNDFKSEKPLKRKLIKSKSN